MTSDQSHSEQYERVRTEFESLNVEDRAVFLLEATLSTVARGIDEAGRALARGMEDLFRRAEEATAPKSTEERRTPPNPGPATPRDPEIDPPL